MAKKIDRRQKKNRAQIKSYLKNKGHKAADVDRMLDAAMNTTDEVSALCQLHGVSASEWQAAKGAA